MKFNPTFLEIPVSLSFAFAFSSGPNMAVALAAGYRIILGGDVGGAPLPKIVHYIKLFSTNSASLNAAIL
jgi:hypothetical protein